MVLLKIIVISIFVLMRYLILLFIIASCQFPEKDCLKFQTGTFIFESISSNGDTLKTKFTRSKNLEIGYFDNKLDSSSVKWVSDCECIYRKINPKSLNEKKPVQMKILSTNKDSYVFEYSFVGDTKNKQRGYVEKIN